MFDCGDRLKYNGIGIYHLQTYTLGDLRIFVIPIICSYSCGLYIIQIASAVISVFFSIIFLTNNCCFQIIWEDSFNELHFSSTKTMIHERWPMQYINCITDFLWCYCEYLNFLETVVFNKHFLNARQLRKNFQSGGRLKVTTMILYDI